MEGLCDKLTLDRRAVLQSQSFCLGSGPQEEQKEYNRFPSFQFDNKDEKMNV